MMNELKPSKMHFQLLYEHIFIMTDSFMLEKSILVLFMVVGRNNLISLIIMTEDED